jgi:hypothetical protein
MFNSVTGKKIIDIAIYFAVTVAGVMTAMKIQEYMNSSKVSPPASIKS